MTTYPSFIGWINEFKPLCESELGALDDDMKKKA